MSTISTQATKLFLEAGFNYSVHHASDNSFCVEILFPQTAPPDAATRLSDGIQEAERTYGDDATVWLRLQDATTAPAYINEAIENCREFGVRIFLSDNFGRVSHGNGELIPTQLLDSIKAAGKGRRWSPVAGTFVS